MENSYCFKPYSHITFLISFPSNLISKFIKKQRKLKLLKFEEHLTLVQVDTLYYAKVEWQWLWQ